jgi:hypothetical protein
MFVFPSQKPRQKINKRGSSPNVWTLENRTHQTHVFASITAQEMNQDTVLPSLAIP